MCHDMWGLCLYSTSLFCLCLVPDPMLGYPELTVAIYSQPRDKPGLGAEDQVSRQANTEYHVFSQKETRGTFLGDIVFEKSDGVEQQLEMCGHGSCWQDCPRKSKQP